MLWDGMKLRRSYAEGKEKGTQKTLASRKRKENGLGILEGTVTKAEKKEEENKSLLR